MIVICSEFLTGFHKRKLARKKKAKEDFEKKLKEEKRRVKAEVNVFNIITNFVFINYIIFFRLENNSKNLRIPIL